MVDLYKMCYGKVSFPTKASAEKHAIKHNQKVYRCPICFCLHCTKNSDWRKEYVHITEYQKLFDELQVIQNSKNSPERNKLILENLKTQVKCLEEKLANFKKENSIEEIRNGYKKRIYQLQEALDNYKEREENSFENQFPMIF